uniref:uncharacterized protein LOC113474741 n=1 Tax=Ciona intestinalis TaxID=7719 RepID=UPI000EF44105|nr:uncharacterized protein LOC113474741 [Ciona intestinalis]|eukprot:XP_026692880.1 uncharacterized protein LOC113474741 [Ciona intestinalis]
MAAGVSHTTVTTPHYPFETCGKSLVTREKIERTLQSRASLQSASLQNFYYRGNRLHNYGYPSVISSTQQLLALTPTKLGVSPIWRRGAQHNRSARRRSSAKDLLPPMTSWNSDVTKQGKSPSPISRGSSVLRLHSNKHSARTTPALPSTPQPVKPDVNVKVSATQASILGSTPIKVRSIQAYHDQMRSYFGPRRNNDPNFVARKMAPVLRVVPATTRLWVRETSDPKPKVQKPEASDNSQKRVRFSDQMGLPLVRNMTPNYRRKHSYILRWLETAGRPIQPMA